ncbi:MAG: hypothetical protein ACRDSP_10800 [Pseudonocardiaceae bacterium]
MIVKAGLIGVLPVAHAVVASRAVELMPWLAVAFALVMAGIAVTAWAQRYRESRSGRRTVPPVVIGREGTGGDVE